MYTRLEKIDPGRNQWRFYALSVQPTLFGEWAFIREWGRLGNEGGQIVTAYYPTENEALDAFDVLKRLKAKRGYVACPEQLALTLWG